MTEPASEFWTALGAVQAEAPLLPKDGRNPAYGGSKYATLAAIVEQIRPLLAQHGLVWSTFPAQNDGTLVLQCRLIHAETGQSFEGEMPLLLGKNDSQGFGSAITYARRYSLCAVLNLVADEDDDGNAAGGQAAGRPERHGSTVATDKQKAAVRRDFKRFGLTKGDVRVMLTQAGVADTEDVEAAVDGLFKHQASKLLDNLKDGRIPSAEHPSDVTPADDNGFEHPPTNLLGTPLEDS